MRSGLHGARARAWITAITAWLVLAPRLAHAEPTTFDLAWSAPPECPSRDAIVDATRARLGASGSEEPPALFVQGSVTPERGGFLVSLAMKDRSNNPVGQRQVHVEGPSCSAVADATALVLAMIIAARPRSGSPSAPPPQEPSPARAEPIAPATRGPSAPASRAPEVEAPPSSSRGRLMVGAAGVVSRGVLPAVGAGLALRATYSPVPLLFLGVETSFEAGGSIQDADSEVDFQFAAGAALAGLRILRTDRFELILALGARAGAIRTSSVGLRLTQGGIRAIALVGPGALLRAKLAPSFFLEALPQAEAVLVRDRFHIRDGETVYPIHRAATVAGRFSLGIAYEFP